MAEYDTITVTNPSTSEFMARFNGEPYTIGAGEEKSFPQFIGFHIAKKLSDSLLSVEAKRIANKDKENPYAPAASQLLMHDNPKRRIFLFQILRDVTLVEQCVNAFPLNGFIGEMSEYDEFVKDYNTDKDLSEEIDEEKEVDEDELEEIK